MAKGEITQLLEEWSGGDRQALDRLIPKVVDELRAIAGNLFRREDQGHTWQPTEVVDELVVHLVERRSVDWKNRRQFFRTAAQIMRRLLVDHARQRRTTKRGGAAVTVSMRSEPPSSCRGHPADLLALHEALERLEALEPRQSQVVELKCFTGLTFEEIAEVLECGLTTVKKDWRIARAFLVRELGHHPATDPS